MKKHLLRFLLLAALVDILVGVFYFTALIFPKIYIGRSNEINIYDTNHSLVLQQHHDNEVSFIEIEKMSPDLPVAFICSEDASFYEHYGFNLKGILRAIKNNIFKGTTQGGSTISQQLSRSLFLDNQKKLSRKLQEAFLTARIEMHYSKKQILEQYLNSIYLGHDLYGVEAASLYYFHKSSSELTLDEAAMLAGIANAPNHNAPDLHYDKAISRRNYVLKNMFSHQYINEETYQNYTQTETKITISPFQPSLFLPYFREVKKQLESLHLYTKTNLAKGLNVYTYLDKNVTQTVADSLKNNRSNDGSQTAVVILKPYTNQVLCMFGSNELDDQFNRATMANRQSGSAIKPLLYYLALEYGFSPLTTFISEETTFYIENYGAYSPKNSNNQYANGPINMIEAIAVSDNIYATKTTLFLGSQNFIRLLAKFHIDHAKAVPSAGLGVNDISLLKLTNIYNTFASEGMYYAPSYIYKVTDKKGNVLYQDKTSGKRLLDKEATLILNQLLTATFDKNAKGYATPTMLNYQPNARFAAKTGSTATDSFTLGFNPNYTIGIWNGYDDNTELTSYVVTKKIFLEVVNQLTYQQNKNYWYTMPSSCIAKRIHPLTGKEEPNANIYWLKR